MNLSVIIPIYNGEPFVKDLLITLNAITYQDFEAIFIDNNSTDQSLNLLQKELSKANFNYQLLSEERQGQGYARNTGIAKAKGKYIAFLDCDDRVHPEKFATDLALFEQHNVDFVFCRSEKLYSDGRALIHPIDGFKKGLNNAPDLGLIWLLSYFKLQGTGAVMITKTALNKLGGFHTMRTGQDAFLFIRMGLVCKGYFYDKVMFFYYRHASSTVSERNKKKDGTLHSYFNLRKELFKDEIIQSNPKAKTILKNQLLVDLLKMHRKGYNANSLIESDLNGYFVPPLVVWNPLSLLINKFVPHIKYNPFYQFWYRLVKN
ncbi:glycosyltransferase family 2 protein [Winogradskyella sp. R77965]|uniref:glycosyltransferase family 2 protein n=1 Tax=Winogradskyella sp. R77965 TaxID=3093872 RepID=UPI0037DD8F19